MCKVIKCAVIIWTVTSVAVCDAGSSSRGEVQRHEYVRIPAGINAGYDPDEGQYESKMNHDVFMDTTEVTFAKWRSVRDWAKTNGYEFVNGDKLPEIFGGGSEDESFEEKVSNAEDDNLPVTGMTWYDCLKWCNARSEMDGLDPIYYVEGKPYRKGVCDPVADVSKSGWRLPTENEWRYAARGGEVGLRFPWGNTISHENANYSGSKDPAWPYDLSEGEHPIYKRSVARVASFAPNGYGLYDMAGNAWEFAWDTSGKWIPICGGCSSSLAHFLKIQHADGREKLWRGSGLRTMRLASGESKSDAIAVNQELVSKMADAIKQATRQSKSTMAHLARNMATFPSWNKSLKGESYSVGDYICIWHKAPLLDIYADASRWQAGLGEAMYSARIKELRSSNISYLHSLAIYNPSWYDCGGMVPIPVVVITVEKSNSSDIPFVCAFTPEGHVNFCSSKDLSSDEGLLLNGFAAVSLALGNTLNKIGSSEDGFSRLKRLKNKPKGNVSACSQCKGSGLVGGSVCSKCKGWGKVSTN